MLHLSQPLIARLAPVLVVGALASTLVPAEARACGGMFCSQVSPTPIDQSAEKILFEVRPDGSVTATVEIKYNGDPQDFAWIVPVSGTPDFVEVAEKDELLLLDQATRPSIIPPTTICSNPPSNPLSFGCNADQAFFAPSGSEGEGEGEGVNVTNYPSVGPFDDIVVVDGVDPGVLMTWLRDHDYQVTEEMRPFIEQYTLEGYSFLATRLQANAEVQDMVPIRFHCPQPNPEIPLRLTAIAAEPDMGFLVFVAGPERFELANYEDVQLGLTELQTDNNSGVTNYFALVSKNIDEAGGRGFVVERADTAQQWQGLVGNTFLGTETEQAARVSVTDMLGRQQFVTRFYARMSADEMTEDPVFVPAGNAETFTSFDLSSRTYDACPISGAASFPPSVPTCGTLYCGSGDACALSEQGSEGCLCRGDHVARSTTSPAGGVQVVCMSPEIDVHGGDGNPCAGHSCGPGTCLPVNDRPTCQCEEGAVGVIANGLVTCSKISGDVFESGQILWPAPEALDVPPTSSGCTSSNGDRAGGAASIALLFASAAVLRRVLRRRR